MELDEVERNDPKRQEWQIIRWYRKSWPDCAGFRGTTFHEAAGGYWEKQAPMLQPRLEACCAVLPLAQTPPAKRRRTSS
eukprot:g19553.t1